eukprot:GFUD01015748.1.p1 GENE.GFUD01015748.1~~GFUD01015748.1.p1  ORF type:complete len:122 (-),score=67.92 GFUD01015748.1:314-679(-)
MMDMLALESRLASLEKRLLDAQKERENSLARQSKCDRELRDLESCKLEDERHNTQMNKMVTSLEEKVDMYKTQASEAEQVAANNLNMFRRKQQELEEAEERARKREEDWARCKGKEEMSKL